MQKQHISKQKSLKSRQKLSKFYDFKGRLNSCFFFTILTTILHGFSGCSVIKSNIKGKDCHLVDVYFFPWREALHDSGKNNKYQIFSYIDKYEKNNNKTLFIKGAEISTWNIIYEKDTTVAISRHFRECTGTGNLYLDSIRFYTNGLTRYREVIGLNGEADFKRKYLLVIEKKSDNLFIAEEFICGVFEKSTKDSCNYKLIKKYIVSFIENVFELKTMSPNEELISVEKYSYKSFFWFFYDLCNGF